MTCEIEVIPGEVHDTIIGRLNWMGKTYESKASPEMGHLTREDLTELALIFREKLEKNLLEMIERDFGVSDVR